MGTNTELLQRFYAAFQARDGEGMAACYAPEIVFSDPVFPHLEGPRAGGMWKMLASRARDLRLEVTSVAADDTSGHARWVARYTFAKTGRPVVNVVDSRFELRGGRIVRQTDDFDFWRWARQALGPVGSVLGWTGFLQRKVQAEAAANLDAFLRKVGTPVANVAAGPGASNA